MVLHLVRVESHLWGVPGVIVAGEGHLNLKRTSYPLNGILASLVVKIFPLRHPCWQPLNCPHPIVYCLTLDNVIW